MLQGAASASSCVAGKLSAAASAMRGLVSPLFGLRPCGTAGDLPLWRNQRLCGVVLSASSFWVAWDVLDCQLVPFLGYSLIASLSITFLLSRLSPSLNMSPPRIPDIAEDVTVNIMRSLIRDMNRGLATLWNVGHSDLKKFLMVVTALWAASVLGSCCHFSTFFYAVFAVPWTLRFLYEKSLSN